jgi:hypothetical protein
MTDNGGGGRLQRRSKTLTRMRSWTGCQRSLPSIAGTACRFNRYDERCKSIGPVHLLAIGFGPEAKFEGRILDELAKLERKEMTPNS